MVILFCFNSKKSDFAAKCAWPAAAAPWVLAVRSLCKQARVLVAAAVSMVVSYKRRCPGKPPIIATYHIRAADFLSYIWSKL